MSMAYTYIWLNPSIQRVPGYFALACTEIHRQTADTITSVPHFLHTDKLPLPHLLSGSIIVSSEESSRFIRPGIFSLKLNLMHKNFDMWLILKISQKVQKLQEKVQKYKPKRVKMAWNVTRHDQSSIPPSMAERSHSDPDEQCWVQHFCISWSY